MSPFSGIRGRHPAVPTLAQLMQQAHAKRDDAARARRWAGEMTAVADREFLLRIAVELEAEAAELDRQANAPVTLVQPPGFSTTQPIQQVRQEQQQQGLKGPGDNEKPED